MHDEAELRARLFKARKAKHEACAELSGAEKALKAGLIENRRESFVKAGGVIGETEVTCFGTRYAKNNPDKLFVVIGFRCHGYRPTFKLREVGSDFTLGTDHILIKKTGEIV